MPDQPGSTYTPLRSPCPRCGGILEREDKGKIQNPQPNIVCRQCQATWPDYKAMSRERSTRDSQPAGKKAAKLPSLDQIKGFLCLGKIATRGGRSVVGRARAMSQLFREIADEAQQFEGMDSVARGGRTLEQIIDQALLAVEDVEEAKKGNLRPEPEEEEGEEEEK